MADSTVAKPPKAHPNPDPTITWHESMKRAIRDSRQLLNALQLDIHSPDLIKDPSFPVFVPLEYLSRIEPRNPIDPLFLQIAPLAAEEQSTPGFNNDPVGDSRFEAAPGLLHKYHGRVLLITSGACGVHCRYCFRRHYPYQTAPKSIQQWEGSLAYISKHSSINEVILSGGDPLTIVDTLLEELLKRIELIPHVKRLRIHTRMPVVIPQRVTQDLCNILRKSRLSKWIVLHVNHPREIDQQVEDGIRDLNQTGATILNQAVLLRGVNDDESTLLNLCERLIENQIIPYYINQLDQVAGSSHFHVPIERGLALIKHLQGKLPGYAVPRYVQDSANLDLESPPKSKLSLL